MKRQDIGGRQERPIALKMLGSLDMVLILWRLHGLVLMIVVAIWANCNGGEAVPNGTTYLE